MARGRPTKWSKALEDKAKEYVSGGWRELDAIPSHVGLCAVLEVRRETLYAWAKDDGKNFSNILEKCKTEQERVLLNMGLTGEYNSNIVKLVLGKHGYNDKPEEEEQAPQALAVNINVVDASKDA